MVPGEEWKRKRWITMDRSERGGVKVEKRRERESTKERERQKERNKRIEHSEKE